MKRTAIVTLICILFLLMATGCNRPDHRPLSEEDAAIRVIADSAVMEKYSLEDLRDFQIEAYTSPDGVSHARYKLQICGYDAHDTISIDIDTDGTITQISDTLGKYSVFLDRVTPLDIWWAKCRLMIETMGYESKDSDYYLSIDQNGNLQLRTEIIEHIQPSSAGEGQASFGGCGIDHEHLFFGKVICSAP